MAIDTAPQANAAPRTRRALLAGALGGLAATVAAALGRPGAASAAAGSTMIIGSEANNAGAANTQLLTNSSVVAFKLLQNGPGTALMGYATPASGATRGVYGRSDSPNGYGVQARNAGAAGTGAAVQAIGVSNDGIETSTASAIKVALRATNSAVDGTVALFENTSGGTGGSSGPAIRAYTGGGSNADVHPAGAYTDAAGEFAGPNGVIGASLPGGGYGVVGLSAGGMGVRGVSPSGYGVGGVSTSGYGVHGQSSTSIGVVGSAGGIGVYGISNSSSGVHGQSTSGRGVYGGTSSNYGVHGSSGSNNGVYGQSTSGVGVYGYTDNGDASAGYFEGLLTASSKNFRIDHPVDPAGKVLVHSCVESDERLTVYAGTVTTDGTGEAVIGLPAWFDALNRDLRYQLTVIGSFAQAMVKRKVAGNRFTIATSEPGTEVCWQVTGVRQDAYARAHPLVVESAKAGKEKGRYLNPREHGQPDSKRVDHELRQAEPSVIPTPP